MPLLDTRFFQRDACQLAQALLGKIIRRKYHNKWLAAQIIETEAYYLEDKASHASLGFTEKRKALFMPAGTIYMYYARGSDSLNISAEGEGNAVLIKSACFFQDRLSDPNALQIMQQLNPAASGAHRPADKLCAGQTLLCKALHLKVSEWDQQQFNPELFYLDDTGYRPSAIIQTTRLGIPKDRDQQLMYRFIDADYCPMCTRNPLTQRNCLENRDYIIHKY
ncbi:MAG: DNA-3-methyladenine glycosylase [Gammaproteobacteria bacterium]|nr:DNA-3-methyladenine glycosylase [Gammaproteobacteria bacterium]